MFGPAGRKLPMLPLLDRPAGLPARRRQLRRARRPVVVGRPPAEAERRDPPARPLPRPAHRDGAALRKTLRYLFPDHWSFLLGEVALYCFIVLVATGTYLALFYSDSTHEVVYHGPYAPLQGQHMTEAYRSVVDISTTVKAGPADPPDPPLGGRRLRRGDRPPPAAGLLHRRLPQAARAHLLARPHDPRGHAARGVPRLLAGRRPALRDGARDRERRRALDPVRRREPRRLIWGGPFPGGRRSSRGCTSRTCSCSRR